MFDSEWRLPIADGSARVAPALPRTNASTSEVTDRQRPLTDRQAPIGDLEGLISDFEAPISAFEASISDFEASTALK